MLDHQENGVSTTPLATVADARAPIVYGIVQPGPEIPGGVPFVQSRDVGGAVDVNALNRTSEQIAQQYRRSKIAPGDILFSLRGNIGQSSMAPAELDGANIARGVARIRVGAKGDPEFFRYVLQGPVLQRLIARNANGSTFRELSIEELRKLPIPDVSLPEQRKIAEILRTWDEALEKLTALRAAKARWLDGLAAKLIHDEQAERLHRLRDFLREVSRRNRGQQVERVLSVTNSAGFVLAEDLRAPRSLRGPVQLQDRQAGHYAYLRPASTSAPSRASTHGKTARSARCTRVPSARRAGFRFLRALASLGRAARQRIALAAQGSVRETVSFGDLGSILIPVPTIDRQRAISRVLNAGRDEIALIDAEIEALTRQKRGLMQKLLTGEWRVTLEEPVA